jgi:hypothetical protein
MKARTSAASLTPGAVSTPEDTSTPAGRVAAMAAATVWGVRPPESMKPSEGSSALSRLQSKVAPWPPGRVASLGGLASSSSRSAQSAKPATAATSSALPIEQALRMAMPASSRMAATRCGVSGPCNWIQSGPSAATCATSVLSGLTSTTQVSARPRASEIISPIGSSSRWRGERAKCMKPTMSAPASMAASRIASVLMPQILMMRGSLMR